MNLCTEDNIYCIAYTKVLNKYYIQYFLLCLHNKYYPTLLSIIKISQVDVEYEYIEVFLKYNGMKYEIQNDGNEWMNQSLRSLTIKSNFFWLEKLLNICCEFVKDKIIEWKIQLSRQLYSYYGHFENILEL